MTPEKRFISSKFHRLSMAIFNQAVTDIQLTTTTKAIKNDAWRWLLNDGYRFCTDLIGFEMPTDKYLKMLQSISKKPPKPKRAIKKDPEIQLQEDLEAIQLMGLQDSQEEFFQVLEKVRNKSTTARAKAKPKLYRQEATRQGHIKSLAKGEDKRRGSNFHTTAKLGRGGQKSRETGTASARVNRVNFFPNMKNLDKR